MLFGPKDFPVLRIDIISNISRETEGAVKRETLSPMKSTDLGIVVSDIMRNIYKELIEDIKFGNHLNWNLCNNKQPLKLEPSCKWSIKVI